MDDLIKKLASDEGFIEAFWAECSRRQRAGMRSSHKDVYDSLNNQYYQALGVYRWVSYDAFRKKRDRIR